MAKNRGKTPPRPQGKIADRTERHDYNNSTPRFCLRHIQAGFDVHTLDRDRRAAFAMSLQKRATMTWQEILRADRHGLGTEKIACGSIRPSVPEAFQDADHFVVLRYDGLRPMVGVRTNDTFHVVWIEPNFGDLYEHG